MPNHTRPGVPSGPLIIDEAMRIPTPASPGPQDEWIAYGVRWTNQSGETAIQPITGPGAAPWHAEALATMLRQIQAERGTVPDAGVVIRRMRGAEPLTAWTAAGPSEAATS